MSSEVQIGNGGVRKPKQVHHVVRRADTEKEHLGERLEKEFKKFPNGCWDQCECGDNRRCDIEKGQQELATFKNGYKPPQVRDGKENFFHIMVKDKDWLRCTPKIRRFLSWMLQQKEHHAMLVIKDQHGCTPMHNALSNKIDYFVNMVLATEGLIIANVLKQETSTGNCLHLATRHQFPDLSVMVDKCTNAGKCTNTDNTNTDNTNTENTNTENANTNILMAMSPLENETPLHIAVRNLCMLTVTFEDLAEKKRPDIDEHCEGFGELSNQDCYESDGPENREADSRTGSAPDSEDHHESDKSEDREADSRTGSAPDSNCDIARFKLETIEQREERLRNILQDLDEETARPRPPPKTLDTTDPEDPASQSAEERRIHIQPSLQDTMKVTSDVMELSEADSVRLLVEVCPNALMTLNKSGRTPYQEREEALLNDPVVEDLINKYAEKSTTGSGEARKRAAQRMMVVKDPVAHYIRSYCMRSSMSRKETMSCLYRPGQERHIEFDLAGKPTPVIPPFYLEKLAYHLRFESLLKYVALPILTVEVPVLRAREEENRTPQGRQGSELQALRNGRSDLVVVFDWLWQMGVREIIKVMVIDDREQPHADSAIVEALYGFKVEEWDWKRVDLGSDVIYESSRNVREVSLYSSGNNAVLMGWGSTEGGFGDRDKFPYLEKVNLFVQDGLEDKGRREWNTKRCADKIKSHSQAKLINVIPDNKKVSFSSQFSNSTGYIDEAPPWLKCIKDFSKFLKNASMTQDNQVAPVKIAIIDDGIDATVTGLQSRITGGATFCPYPHSTEFVNSYFVPSGKHGTLMAMLICDICPDSQLYIARVEELTRSSDRFTAGSAAKAVEWAINCGVSIISMSWTIQTTAQDNEDMKLLKDAITKAASANILMFCSTSDQGGNTNESCYPGDWGQCIRIGGATFTGDKLTWVDDKVDFWFPGRDVPFHLADAESVTYESGSSVATAAASGLAGALIYCARLVKGNDKAYFQDRDLLQKAFEKMATGKDGKFPRTDAIFREMFTNKLRQRDPTLRKSLNIAMLAWDDVSKQALSDLLLHIQGK